MGISGSVVEVTGAEQALIGHCMTKSHLIGEIGAALDLSAVTEPFHRRVLEIMFELHAAGRTPSLESIVAVTGNDELAPRLTIRDYLKRIVTENLFAGLLPWRDAVEVIHEGTRRAELHDIGSAIMSAAVTGKVSTSDIASEAVSRLDDVIAAERAGTISTYDAAAAGEMAVAHLDGANGRWPSTGLVDLDGMLGGWPIGQLSVLAARPSMGKSAAATSTVLSAARKGHACLFFSIEMSGEQLGSRLLTDLAYTHPSPLMYEDILFQRNDRIGERGRRLIEHAQGQLKNLPLRIDQGRGLTMSDIAARARKYANELSRNGQKLEIVVVDHMLLIRPSGRYAGNRVREVAEISDALATLAKDLDCAVVALCQLNRGVEGRDNKRPTLADLRDSGAIEEDAATVTFLYRPAYYLSCMKCNTEAEEAERAATLEQKASVLEYIVAKNRNGQIGTVEAFVDIGANAIRSRYPRAITSPAVRQSASHGLVPAQASA